MPHSLRTTLRAALFVAALAVLSCQSDPGSLLDEGGSNPGDATLRQDIHSESGGGGGGSIGPPPVVYTCTSQAIQAAQMLATRIPLPSTSEVMVTQVPPGTTILEDSPDSLLAVSITVPLTYDNYYAFFVDDAPDAKYSHPTRLAWVGLLSGNYGVIDAEWSFELDKPGVTPGQISEIASFSVNSTRFTCVIGEKNIHVAPAWMVDRKPNASGISGCAGPTPRKMALVIDMGDKLRANHIASECARDADNMKSWLESKQFTVQRISQFWNNLHPAMKDTDQRAQFVSILQSYANYFRCDSLPDGQCHEFFLYLGGHGGATEWFPLYSPDGSGSGSVVTYSMTLRPVLESFPKWVKLIVFVDTCYSGRMIPALQGLCGTGANARTCGVTLVSATDADHTAPAGKDGGRRSATENFLYDTNFDYDNDGKVGDFSDRWQYMQIRANLGLPYPMGDYNPQRALCEGQTSMCSTD